MIDTKQLSCDDDFNEKFNPHCVREKGMWLKWKYPDNFHLHVSYTISSWWSSLSKNFKTPFFLRYLKILPFGYWNGSRTLPKNFLGKCFKKYRCYALAKLWHKKWHSRHISCAMTKIFSPIYYRFVCNKWRKFQKDILNSFGVTVDFFQIDCMLMACSCDGTDQTYGSHPWSRTNLSLDFDVHEKIHCRSIFCPFLYTVVASHFLFGGRINRFL